jgi:hypothetical protein
MVCGQLNAEPTAINFTENDPIQFVSVFEIDNTIHPPYKCLRIH